MFAKNQIKSFFSLFIQKKTEKNMFFPSDYCSSEKNQKTYIILCSFTSKSMNSYETVNRMNMKASRKRTTHSLNNQHKSVPFPLISIQIVCCFSLPSLHFTHSLAPRLLPFFVSIWKRKRKKREFGGKWSGKWGKNELFAGGEGGKMKEDGHKNGNSFFHWKKKFWKNGNFWFFDCRILNLTFFNYELQINYNF